MSYKFTRRRFLETALAAPAVMGVAAEVKDGQTVEPPEFAALDEGDRASLRAAMDEIIPAGDGMPAASSVGGLEYLERLCLKDNLIMLRLGQALDLMAQESQMTFHADFLSLSPAQRFEILTKMEATSPEAFATLRDLVYESYYTQSAVWKLIGYEFHPTNQAGPHMPPFDESVLAQVRKLPKHYREVSGG
jgi:hypothetical protein